MSPLAVPGEKVLRVTSTPGDPLLLDVLREMLCEALPAELLTVEENDGAILSLKAVAFMDYVPVYLEARDLGEDDGNRTLALRPTRFNDVVRFLEFVTMVEVFLKSRGFEVLAPSTGAHSQGPRELFDDFDDFDGFDDELADDEFVWAERLQPLLADALAQPKALSSSVREEAAQGVARISESGTPACHVALVQGLREKEEQLIQVLSAASDSLDLAVAYPLASSLKSAAHCLQAGQLLVSLDKILNKINDCSLLAREINSIKLAITEAQAFSTSCALPLYEALAVKGSMYPKLEDKVCLSACSTACSTGDMMKGHLPMPKGLNWFSEKSTDFGETELSRASSCEEENSTSSDGDAMEKEQEHCTGAQNPKAAAFAVRATGA